MSDESPPEASKHPWIEKYLADWLPEGIVSDVREVSNAPRAIVAIAVLGAVGGWWLASAFYAERIAVLHARLDAQPSSNTQKHNGTPPQGLQSGNALISWGGGIPTHCGATLNRAPLAQYADKYDVAVVCGYGYANVDKFADRGISISPKFSLSESSPIPLLTPSTEAMTTGLRTWLQAEYNKVPPEKRPLIRVNLPVWYEVLLVPKEVLVSDIRSLSDLRRLGGEVASGQGRAVIGENLQLLIK